ncbi:MAG: HNH endonuclease [Candidatus Krumholzibacteriota bacterium]|nr:HNH endonuclease [Candidatus Krumholzibacteriota bacterium]
MKIFIGVTDNSWFRYLSVSNPDEVNFWRPSGRLFGAIETGAPFLFKLHSPLNYIAGGGYFVNSYKLPLSLAWDAFKEKNGAPDYMALKQMILSYRSEKAIDPEIGCTILNEPFFFPKEYWIPVPDGWSQNIVTGKTYDTKNAIGGKLWDQVLYNLSRMSLEREEFASDHVLEERQPYGKEYLLKARLGQGAFRVMVTEAYHKSCTITGERTLPVLEASHIKPFAEEGPNRTNNGLLLRSDLHILFDRGYISITPDFHVVVSKRIKEEFQNGREYYPLHGKKIENLPDLVEDRPSEKFIEWHNENIYVA